MPRMPRIRPNVPLRCSAQVTAVRDAAIASIHSEWLLPKSAAGIRFGRVAKDLHGFSVDAVLMDVPGPSPSSSEW